MLPRSCWPRPLRSPHPLNGFGRAPSDCPLPMAVSMAPSAPLPSTTFLTLNRLSPKCAEPFDQAGLSFSQAWPSKCAITGFATISLKCWRVPSRKCLRKPQFRNCLAAVRVHIGRDHAFPCDQPTSRPFSFFCKHRPAQYLDPAVRANISSFASLAPAAELHHGLVQLKADLQSGAFALVKERYASEYGDYEYVTARLGM